MGLWAAEDGRKNTRIVYIVPSELRSSKVWDVCSNVSSSFGMTADSIQCDLRGLALLSSALRNAGLRRGARHDKSALRK